MESFGVGGMRGFSGWWCVVPEDVERVRERMPKAWGGGGQVGGEVVVVVWDVHQVASCLLGGGS